MIANVLPTIFTIEIGNTPTLTFEAQNLREAHELCHEPMVPCCGLGRPSYGRGLGCPTRWPQKQPVKPTLDRHVLANWFAAAPIASVDFNPKTW